MNSMDIIKADSDTFWKWAKANPIAHAKPVYIASEESKKGRKGKGKNKKPGS